MSLSVRMLPEVLRSASGLTSGTYTPLVSSVSTTGAFANPIRIFHLQNLTSGPVFFSIAAPGTGVPAVDGSADHIILNSQTFILLDVTSDASLPPGELYIQQGSIVYARAQSTATGSVYLSVFYGKGFSQ